jgi:hypothetical protein
VRCGIIRYKGNTVADTDRDNIYEEAGLTQEEVDCVESYIEGDNDGEFSESSAHDKLLDYYVEDIPYAIQSQSSWHPDNTCTPDEWILDKLGA